jgi:CubicO group peptidase (beta-lactamase class C family)
MRCATLMVLLVATNAFGAAQSWPDKIWPRTTPAAVGLAPAPLAALDADFTSGKIPLIDSFLVARCGAIAYERSYTHDYATIYKKEAHERGPLNPHLTGPYNYFDPDWHPYFHGTSAHSMQSVSKTVTATVIGIAIARGDFKASLDTPVLQFFDVRRVKNIDDRKRRMKLRNVLTMTTGLDWNEDLPYNDPHNPTAPMEASRDWVSFVIDLPMVNEPGSIFAYSSGATELLAHIFKRATGQDIEAYAKRHLFEPLGIRDYHWKRTPLGVVDTEGGLFLTSEDLARIGYLYLRGGRWHDEQLIAPEFLKEALTPHIDAGSGWKYGYKWWLYPYDSRLVWTARGFGGQQLMIFPEDDLIVVTTAWDILTETPIFHPIFEQIRAAVGAHTCVQPQ